MSDSPSNNYLGFSTGQCATYACMLEVTAPKVGNVHRGADFEDLTLNDFLAAAIAIGPAMDEAAETGVGTAAAMAARHTRLVCKSNVNLGIILLLAPLATVANDERVTEGLPKVLSELSPEDAAGIYQAINTMQPGGMGTVAEHDVHDSSPPVSLMDAMKAAESRDLIARQYVNGFEQVLNECLPTLIRCCKEGATLADAIVYAHVEQMSRHPDSLIGRKCGPAVADESAARAMRVIESGPISSEPYLDQLEDLDFWLRSDHHRRNPGTSADIIAAALFAGLRDDDITQVLLADSNS